MDLVMEEYDKKLAELEVQHNSLQFDDFTNKTALDIGFYLIKKAQEGNKSITVDIAIGPQQLFHCALEGTTNDNDNWVIRKNRVTNKFHKSSYYISVLLKSKNITIEEEYGLSSADYAPFGGSYPVFVTGKGLAGTITVSGLLDHEDHEMVVDAIEWYLGSHRIPVL